MPYSNPEDQIKWNKDNPEKMAKHQKKWRQNNKERVNELNRQWRKTDKGKKASHKASWLKRGLHIGDDFDLIYERYINVKKCDFCNKEIKKPIMEHNHYSGECRGIVCHSCNCIMAKKDKDFQTVMYELTRWHLNKFLA
jgi:hypothetical protein